MDSIEVHTLDNGLTVLFEPIAGTASVAVKWLLPAGAARDRAEALGEAALLEEYLARGAGGMSSREHSDALDRVGAQRSSHVGGHHLSFSATLLGDRLSDAMPLLSAIATDLALDPKNLDAAKSLCVQTIESLPDDPQEYVMLHLRQHMRPEPFNRTGYGSIADIGSITIDQLRDAWRGRAVPGGSILGIAGNVDPAAALRQLERLVAHWEGRVDDVQETAAPLGGVAHVEEDTAQVHIALSCEAPREADADSMRERLAVTVLSGGMSGRLFTEVRERRSLCYSVGASYSGGREHGYITLYAGTTPQRAQDTLDVCIAEIERMREGVTAEEFHRAVVSLKSRLIMQGESTSARAAAICRDAFRLGRPRTLDEVAAEVDAITIDDLNGYLESRAFRPFTLATMGPEALTLPA